MAPPSNNTTAHPEPTPKEETAPPGFDSTEVLEKLDNATDDIKGLKKAIKDVQEVNRLMLIVLFVGFLALLFSIIAAGIDTFRSQSTSQDDLNNSIQQLIIQLQNQKTTTSNATGKT